MSAAINPLFIRLRSLAHFVDQPPVINGVHRFVQNYGLHGAIAAKALYDIATADPKKRGEVIAQDGLVLGSTWLATMYGLKLISEQEDLLKAVSPQIKKAYPSIKPILDRVDMGSPLRKKHFSLAEIQTILKTVLTSPQSKAVKSAHLSQLLPLPGGHDHSLVDLLAGLFKKKPTMKMLKAIAANKMVKFFGVGGMIVLAGLAGGLLYDALQGNRNKLAKVNKIKEGIFQFIANIALCAVGATIGETVADKVGLAEHATNSVSKRMTRFGVILAGLSLGIVWGGMIANWFGRRFVNPFFDWLDKRHQGYTLGQALRSAKTENDRKVEFLDAILHLDDLPTALALAGVHIFVPFIPLFFAVSGARTGVGYRNKGVSPALTVPKARSTVKVEPQFQTASPSFTATNPHVPYATNPFAALPLNSGYYYQMPPVSRQSIWYDWSRQ